LSPVFAAEDHEPSYQSDMSCDQATSKSWVQKSMKALGRPDSISHKMALSTSHGFSILQCLCAVPWTCGYGGVYQESSSCPALRLTER